MEDKQKTVSFVDANNVKYIIKAEITHRNGYPEFTMAGQNGQCHGQCQDSIKPDNNYQKKIIDIWNTWHLNGIYNPIHIKKELPKNFWNTIEKLFYNIEKTEKEKFNSKKVSDCTKEELSEFEEAIIAIGLSLELTFEELKYIKKLNYGYGNCVYEVQGHDYYSGTEDEIFNAVQEYISESLWVFNNSFLRNYGVLKNINNAELILNILQKQYESGNDAIKELVQWEENKDEITQDAINADGVGHFLNSYNGEYDDVNVFGTTYIVCQE